MHFSGAVTIPWDAKAHFHPQLQFLADSWHRGLSPFWTPYVFSGSPQVADPLAWVSDGDRKLVIGDPESVPAGAYARLTDDEITVAKNGGGAHLDLMTASYILSVAECGAAQTAESGAA